MSAAPWDQEVAPECCPLCDEWIEDNDPVTGRCTDRDICKACCVAEGYAERFGTCDCLCTALPAHGPEDALCATEDCGRQARFAWSVGGLCITHAARYQRTYIKRHKDSPVAPHTPVTARTPGEGVNPSATPSPNPGFAA